MYAKFLNVLNVIFTVFFTVEFAFTPVRATSPDTKSSDEDHPQIHHCYACPQRTDSVLGLATNSTFFVAFFVAFFFKKTLILPGGQINDPSSFPLGNSLVLVSDMSKVNQDLPSQTVD